VLVSTLLRPSSSAPPKVGSMKYFCASSQVTTSRGPLTESHCASAIWPWRSHGIELCCDGPPRNKDGIPGSLQLSASKSFLEYKRFTTEYSTSLVLLRMSRPSKRKILEKLSTPVT